jgi:hypothetical protein
MFACDAYHFERMICHQQSNAIDAVAKESPPPDLVPASRQVAR